MGRLVLTIMIVMVIAAGAAWLADRPGTVWMTWSGYRIDTSVAFLAAAAAFLGLLAAVAVRTWQIVSSMPRRIRASLQGRRRNRGYRGLTLGMVAVAAGDAREAGRQAKRADVLLHELPLTMLLSAQAAQLAGDDKAAESFFQAMLGHEEMEFLGLSGLLTQSIKRKDWVAALAFAGRAYRLRPKSDWLTETLFELQARNSRWADAELTMRDAVSKRLIDDAQGRHRRAVAAYGQATDLTRAAAASESLRLAQKAVDLDPAFVPAVELAARLLLADGKERRARQMLERTWETSPHPALVALYLDASPDARADPIKAVHAVQSLTGRKVDCPESLFALAQAFAAAKLWGEARLRLDWLLAMAPSARAYRLIAALAADESGDPAVATPWLERASTADPDPFWVCGRCSFAVRDWAPLCPNCDSFDSLSWRTPNAASAMARGASAATPPRLVPHRRDVSQPSWLAGRD